MSWLSRFLASTIGMKVVMALSGIVLFGFVVVHMLGNLQVYLGPKVLDHYAASLQSNQGLVWGVRLLLLGCLVAHIGSSVKLAIRSAKARGSQYKKKQWLSGTYAVRTMRFGGIVIFLFIVYHLLHMTAGTVHPSFQHCAADARGDLICHARANLVAGLSVWYVAVFYIVAQFALAMHLAHGAWSLLRTLGVGSPRGDLLARRFAWTFATVIAVGNISIPLSVLFGIIK